MENPLDQAMDELFGNSEEVQETSEVQEVQEEDSSPTPASEDVSSASDVEDEAIQDEQPVNPDIEVISVTDHKGKREVEIDFSDREKIKKLIPMAYGMRKFQHERDEATSWRKNVEPEYMELKESWSSLEKAFKEGGEEGLINFLAQDENAWNKRIEREKRKWSASPSELEQIRREEEDFKKHQQYEAAQRELEEFKASVQKEKQANEVASLQDTFTRSFESNSFTGKLGDPVAEEEMNQALWTRTKAQLEELYGDQDTIPAEAVRKQFKEVAEKFQRVINIQADKKVTKATANRKAAARVKASAMSVAPSSRKEAAAREQFDKNIRTGNWADGLLSFLNGDVKL